MTARGGDISYGVHLDSSGMELGAARSARALKGAADGIQADLRRLEGVFGTLDKNAVTSLANVERKIQGFSRSTTAALGNVSYQVQDVIVQLQSGTNPLTVFVQQGTQIAGAFGPVAAILGAAAAGVAIATSAILGLNQETEKAPSILDDFVSGMDTAEQRARSYAEALAAASGASAELLRQAAGLEKSQIAKQSAPDISGTIAALRERLLEQVHARAQAGEFFEGATAGPGAGILAAQRAIDEAQAVASQIEAAVKAGDRAGLDQLLVKFGLLTDETKEFVTALQDAASKIQGLNKAESAAATGRDSTSRTSPGIRSDQLRLAAEARRRAANPTLYPDRTVEDERVAGQYRTDAAAKAARDQKAHKQAIEDANAALKRQGEMYERLTDAGAKFIAAIRQRPGGSSRDSNILNTEAANRAALQGRSYSTLDDRVLASERASRDAAKKLWEEANKDQAEQTQRLADLQSDILIEPWRNMADEVSGIADNMFSDLLNKGEISGKSLGEGLTQSINSSLANLGSTLVTAPLQKAIAEIGSGQYSGFMDFASKNQGLVAGTAGILAGQVGGQLLGLDGKYSGLGGTVGALAGGAIGSLFGPLGTAAGAGLGGLLGSLGGGLFGGENNLGNDRSTQTYSSGQGKIVYSDRSFSQGNRNITSGILGEVQTLQEALKDLGASFSDFNLRVEAGNKSGITVNGKKYDTAQDALKGAIEALLGARTGGLTTTQQTILANTKGENAQQIGQDLAFGETYDKLIRGGNQFDQALQALYETFRDATTEAAKLGLATDALAQAHIREANEVIRQRDQATRGVYEQIAAARGDTSLRTQLHMLETQMRELAKTAADLGVPFEEVTRTHQIAADRLVQTYYENIQAMQAQQRGLQQSILDARRGAVGAVDQYLDPIKAALGSQGIGRGVYAGTVTTASAVDEFRALLGMAREGDTSALSQLSGAGQAAVQAARQTYGAGTEFAKVFREIEAGLKDQEGRLEAKRDQVLAQIGTYTEQTVDELVRLRIESIAEFQRQFERLSSDIRAAIEGAN